MSAAGKKGLPDPSARQITDAAPVRGGQLVEYPLTGGTMSTSPGLPGGSIDPRGSGRRGTSNGNARGNASDRQRRRAWLVDTYRANRDVLVLKLGNGTEIPLDTLFGRGEPACRCYRCGQLLTVDTVTVDRIIPGCRGGTYRRDNIRPACGPCNTVTGATTRGRGKGKR